MSLLAILPTALLTASSVALASPRADLLQELDALTAEVSVTSADTSELTRALALVRQARAVLGATPTQSCRDVVFPIYRTLWGSTTALERTVALCRGELASRGRDIAWFHGHTSRTWALPHSLDRAVAYTRELPAGHLDALEFTYSVTERIWSGLDRAMAYAKQIPPGQLDCVRFAHTSTRSTWAEPTALERAIRTCTAP